MAASLKPGARGEFTVEKLGRGFVWLDTGTHRSLVEAANDIEALAERQELKIACLEEIALENSWVDRAQVERTAAAGSDFQCFSV